MRGTVPEEQIIFDPKIERTARRNNSRTREEKRLARLARKEGTSSSTPSTSPQSSPPSSLTRDQDISMEVPPLPPPPEGNETHSALPCWTSSRRLAYLRKQKT